MKYIAFIYQENDEFVATVPDFEAFKIFEESLDELLETLQDASELWLEDEKLPNSNPLEYFTNEILEKLCIPTSSYTTYTLEVEPEAEESYKVSILE